ncbi:hypothetical protein ACFVT5_39385 [Streptomyces sp. NPDC058001]|uniref:hypothetical protein n=1 Tax=Streptomyces sp. NPDC058001 TaxID=3346300 RepID=UPI0036E6A2A5
MATDQVTSKSAPAISAPSAPMPMSSPASTAAPATAPPTAPTTAPPTVPSRLAIAVTTGISLASSELMIDITRARIGPRPIRASPKMTPRMSAHMAALSCSAYSSAALYNSSA